MGRMIQRKTIPEPYRTIRIILHCLYESAIRGGSGQDIRTCRLASGPLPFITKVLPQNYIFMPYMPNLTNKFTIPCVCLYHVYVPDVHSCPNELYNIHGDTHATSKVTVQSEHEPYQSNGDTLDTNPLRISYKLHYEPFSTVCTKRTVTPLSNRSRIFTNRLPESIRRNSLKLIRTMRVVCVNSDWYGTVREGSGHFLTC